MLKIDHATLNNGSSRDESAGDRGHARLAVDVEDAHAVVPREAVAVRLELRGALFQNLDRNKEIKRCSIKRLLD